MKKSTSFLFLLVALCDLSLSVRLDAQAITKDSDIKNILTNIAIQHKILDCDFSSTVPRSFTGIQVTTDPGGDVLLSGQDRRGQSWRASYKATPGAGCQIWKVDLGRNGTFDLAIVTFGGNSSGGWDTTLSLLLFDWQGLPFPWQSTSKFEITDLGIRQLVRLGDERIPAVIVASQSETDSGQGDIEYHAFQFAGAGTSEILGRLGNTIWPINAPVRATVMDGGRTTLSTYKALSKGEEGTKGVSFMSLKGGTDSERRLQLSSGELTVPKALVLDKSGVREITSFPDKAELLALKPGASIKAALGQDCNGDQCAPVVLWISE